MQEQITTEQEDDEFVYKLIVNDKMVCGARTESHSLLLSIKTTKGEEGRGYAKKLLTYLEKVAKEHGATEMKTDDIDPCNYVAICLFKSMGYIFTPIKGDEQKFIEATKNLDEILKIVQLIDSYKKELFRNFDLFRSNIKFPIIAFLGLFGLVWIYEFAWSVFLVWKGLTDITIAGSQITILLSLLAAVTAGFSLLSPYFKESIVDKNYERVKELALKDKNEILKEGKNQHLLKALIKMKAQNREFDLEQIYDMNPSMFTSEKLLERLYD